MSAKNTTSGLRENVMSESPGGKAGNTKSGLRENIDLLLRTKWKRLISNLSQWRSTVYGNTLTVTEEISDTLQDWADVMKGKDDDPDVYFPVEHFRIIYGLDQNNKELLNKLALMGRALRENKDLQVSDTYVKYVD